MAHENFNEESNAMDTISNRDDTQVDNSKLSCSPKSYWQEHYLANDVINLDLLLFISDALHNIKEWKKGYLNQVLG